MDNIFKKACLIQLSSSVWQGTRTIDSNVMRNMNPNHEWLKGRKFLVNPDLISPISTAVTQARSFIQRYSLPFPINSVYLIPKESLTLIDEHLQKYKDKFFHKVGDFEAMYEVAREEAKNILNDLFNEADYPTEITSKFKFSWRYFVIDTPGKSSLLSPEIYEREVAKFKEMMEETRELASTALAQEFGTVVQSLVERLTCNGNGEKPKVLNGNLFNKLTEFLEDFGTRNIFNDERLQELTTQARTAIHGVSSFGLRYNNELREKVSKDMLTLKTSIDAAIEDLPRRKLRLAA